MAHNTQTHTPFSSRGSAPHTPHPKSPVHTMSKTHCLLLCGLSLDSLEGMWESFGGVLYSSHSVRILSHFVSSDVQVDFCWPPDNAILLLEIAFLTQKTLKFSLRGSAPHPAGAIPPQIPIVQVECRSVPFTVTMTFSRKSEQSLGIPFVNTARYFFRPFGERFSLFSQLYGILGYRYPHSCACRRMKACS